MQHLQQVQAGLHVLAVCRTKLYLSAQCKCTVMLVHACWPLSRIVSLVCQACLLQLHVHGIAVEQEHSRSQAVCGAHTTQHSHGSQISTI
jgi:hypothetical protein